MASNPLSSFTPSPSATAAPPLPAPITETETATGRLPMEAAARKIENSPIVEVFQQHAMASTYGLMERFQKKIWIWFRGGTEETFYIKKQYERFQSIILNSQESKLQAAKIHISYLKKNLRSLENPEKNPDANIKNFVREYQNKFKKMEEQLCHAELDIALKKMNQELKEKPYSEKAALVKLIEEIGNQLEGHEYIKADDQLLQLSRFINALPKDQIDLIHKFQGFYELLKKRLDHKIDVNYRSVITNYHNINTLLNKIEINGKIDINNLRILVKDLESLKRSVLDDRLSPEERAKKQELIKKIEAFRKNPGKIQDYFNATQSPYLLERYAAKYGNQMESDEKRAKAEERGKWGDGSPSPVDHEIGIEIEFEHIQERNFAMLMVNLHDREKIQSHLPVIAEVLAFMEAQVDLPGNPNREVWAARLSDFRSELAKLNLSAETWTTIIRLKPFAEINARLNLLIQVHEEKRQKRISDPELNKRILGLFDEINKLHVFFKFRNPDSNSKEFEFIEKQIVEIQKNLIKLELISDPKEHSKEPPDFAAIISKDIGVEFDDVELPVELPTASSFKPSLPPDLDFAAKCIAQEINSYLIAIQFSPNQSVALITEAKNCLKKLSQIIINAEIEKYAPKVLENLKEKQLLLHQKLREPNINQRLAQIKEMNATLSQRSFEILDLLKYHQKAQELFQADHLKNALPHIKKLHAILLSNIKLLLQYKLDQENIGHQEKVINKAINGAININSYRLVEPKNWLEENYEIFRHLNNDDFKKKLFDILNRPKITELVNQWIDEVIAEKIEKDEEFKKLGLIEPSINEEINSVTLTHAVNVSKALDEIEQAANIFNNAVDWKSRIIAINDLGKKIARCHKMLENLEVGTLRDLLEEKLNQILKSLDISSVEVDTKARKILILLSSKPIQPLDSEQILPIQQMIRNVCLKQMMAFDDENVQSLIIILQELQKNNPIFYKMILSDEKLQELASALLEFKEVKNNPIFHQFILKIKSFLDPEKIRAEIAEKLELDLPLPKSKTRSARPVIKKEELEKIRKELIIKSKNIEDELHKYESMIEKLKTKDPLHLSKNQRINLEKLNELVNDINLINKYYIQRIKRLEKGQDKLNFIKISLLEKNVDKLRNQLKQLEFNPISTRIKDKIADLKKRRDRVFSNIGANPLIAISAEKFIKDLENLYQKYQNMTPIDVDLFEKEFTEINEALNNTAFMQLS